MQTMQVTVPEGAVPGQTLSALSPDGQEVAFVVPEGCPPGSAVSINYQKLADFLMLRLVTEEEEVLPVLGRRLCSAIRLIF